MGARKSGLYITSPIEALLAGRVQPLSQRLTSVAERYAAIVAAHRPDLSEAEWEACRYAIGDYWDREKIRLSLVWAVIEDVREDIRVRWGVDSTALALKVRQYDTATLVALVEEAEKLWADQSSSHHGVSAGASG